MSKNKVTLIDPVGYAFQLELTNIQVNVSGTLKTTTIRGKGTQNERAFPATYDGKNTMISGSFETQISLDDFISKNPEAAALMTTLLNFSAAPYLEDDTIKIEGDPDVVAKVSKK